MLDRKTPLIAAAAIGLLVWAGQATAKDPHSEKGCAACHTPHKAHSDVSVPLWATTDHTGGDRVPTATTLTDKTTYDSPTMDAVEAGMEVTGSSILCLSCHDSTSSYSFGAGGMGALKDSHPIGLDYESAILADQASHQGVLQFKTLEEVRAVGGVDTAGKVGCASCHDMHATRDTSDPNEPGNSYLRWAYWDVSGKGGARNSKDFCRNCHLK